MGGSAFENFGLYTPRIPPTVYKYLLHKVKHKLKEDFTRVESAIEAPEKKSHGDIDILVVPHPGAPAPIMDDIAHRLGASNWYSLSGSSIHHLAIPWPSDHECGIPASGQSTQILPDLARNVIHPRGDSKNPGDIHCLPPTNDIPSLASESESSVRSRPSSPDSTSDDGTPIPVSTRHIQVDLTILPDEASLRWALFVNAHGDVTSILSSIIRHKGLTINNQALYVRIADLEAENRKLARVELTRDTSQVLTFLGMDADRFWRPFATLDEMMQYIATCRFHSSHKSREDRTDTQAESTTAADDRRLHSRPAFNYWYRTYLPAHTNNPSPPQAHLSRDEVLDLAFDFFGENTKQRYLKQKQQAETFVAKNRLWSDIRKRILDKQPELEDAEMQQTLKALKREILPSTATTQTWSQSRSRSQCADTSSTSALEQHQQNDVREQPTPVQLAYLNDDFSTVIEWACGNHSAALARYRQMVKKNGGQSFPLDLRKANPFSKTELETYSAEDDRVISVMKGKGRPWGEILVVLGKTSRSQLQAHWRNRLDAGGKAVEGTS